MTNGKAGLLAAGVALTVLAVPVPGQDSGQFTEAQVKRGSVLYAQNCSPCHGPRMMDPQAPADLRKFPPGEKNRFVTSVTKGKNQMPPWGDLFKPEDIEALWAYVIAGEK
jgi:mono/diheme cytochrome c family protein